MKRPSLLWPLLLIVIGVIWLLVTLDVIPAANLWALTYILPFVLIVLGVGLILRSYLPRAGWIVPVLIVFGAATSVIYAPQLGWAGGGPDWVFGSDSEHGGIPGSGKVEVETRKVQDFLSVTIDYPAQVVIRQGKSESLTIEAEDNLLAQLSTEISNGTLVIENRETTWSKRINRTKPVKIAITIKDLHELNISDIDTLLVEGLKTDELSLVFYGAGEVTLKDLDVRKLAGWLTGAPTVYANGIADDLKLNLTGAGSFTGPELACLRAEVSITGAGDATVRVKDDLSATATGAGSINYYGSPSVDENITGAGSVNQVDE